MFYGPRALQFNNKPESVQPKNKQVLDAFRAMLCAKCRKQSIIVRLTCSERETAADYYSKKFRTYRMIRSAMHFVLEAANTQVCIKCNNCCCCCGVVVVAGAVPLQMKWICSSVERDTYASIIISRYDCECPCEWNKNTCTKATNVRGRKLKGWSCFSFMCVCWCGVRFIATPFLLVQFHFYSFRRTNYKFCSFHINQQQQQQQQ